MKMIIAIVQPFMMSDVIRALQGVGGVSGATFTESRGFGRARRDGGMFGEVLPDEAKKIRVEVAVRDEQADEVVRTIQRAAHTGNRGDGKVFVLPIEQALRIASGEAGDDVV